MAHLNGIPIRIEPVAATTKREDAGVAAVPA
jgi:hypothetical protein